MLIQRWREIYTGRTTVVAVPRGNPRGTKVANVQPARGAPITNDTQYVGNPKSL